MTWWIWAIIGIYAAGFILVLGFHLTALQMVTPRLALLRALVWPIWFATGRPHGVPLPMD